MFSFSSFVAAIANQWNSGGHEVTRAPAAEQPSLNEEADSSDSVPHVPEAPERSTFPHGSADTDKQRKRRQSQTSDMDIHQAQDLTDAQFDAIEASLQGPGEQRAAKRARITAAQDAIATMLVPSGRVLAANSSLDPFADVKVKGPKGWLKAGLQVDGLDAVGGAFTIPAGYSTKMKLDLKDPSQPSLYLAFSINKENVDQPVSKKVDDVYQFKLRYQFNRVYYGGEASRKYIVQSWNHTGVDLDQEPVQKSPEQTALWETTKQLTEGCPAWRRDKIHVISLIVYRCMTEGSRPALEDVKDPKLRSTILHLTDRLYSPNNLTLWFFWNKPMPEADASCLRYFRGAIESRLLPLS